MPRFRVSEHRAWAKTSTTKRQAQAPEGAEDDGPPPAGPEAKSLPARTATEAFLEETFGSPQTARRFFTAAIVVMMVVGVTLLGGILASEETPLFAHGGFEPVTDKERIAQYIAPGYASEYRIEVRTGPQKTPDAWVRDDQAHIRLPSVASDEPLYGLRIQVVRLDPDVEPFLMWAKPEEGGTRIKPIADDGVTQTFPVQPFREQGDYRIIFSSTGGSGSLEVKLQLAGAPVLGVQGALQHGPLLFAAGLTLTGLALASLLVFSLWRDRQTSSTGPTEDAGALVEEELHPSPTTTAPQPPQGAAGFGRMEYGTPGVRRWATPGDGVPESLAEGDGKGWVIRLD